MTNEVKLLPITGPDSKTLQALKGNVSEPVQLISHKPATFGQPVNVRLATEGAAMIGLENRSDNQEWAGIFNHIVKTARLATFLGEELNKKGITVNTRLVLNSILLSHAGRRQWDEANWYPDAVEHAQEKAKMGDQPLATDILNKAGISEPVMEVVDAHSFGNPSYPASRMNTWEKKLAMYADYRTAQDYMSIATRFADLKKRGIDERVAKGEPPRYSQELLDRLKAWAEGVEGEVFSQVDIKPEDIKEDYPPEPRWEKYIRRLYISDAEQGIFERLSQLHRQINNGEIGKDAIEKEFPTNTWWGKYVRELYDVKQGVPYHSRVGKQIGIARAIEFYHGLETTTLDNRAKNLPRQPLQ